MGIPSVCCKRNCDDGRAAINIHDKSMTNMYVVQRGVAAGGHGAQLGGWTCCAALPHDAGPVLKCAT